MDCSKIAHYMAFHMAAQELAQHPEQQGNIIYQHRVCRDLGIPLEDMTNDEINFLSRLIKQYYNKGV